MNLIKYPMRACGSVARFAKFLAIGSSCLSGVTLADVRMPTVFGDGMVLQRGGAHVWGWARPGEKVRVAGSWAGEGNAAEGVANEGGVWSVMLATPEAGGPFTLTIAGDTSVVLRDVLVGEVWIASGQSNMEWPIAWSADPAETAAGATDGQIRFFQVENEISLHERIDLNGAWVACSPEAAPKMSAVAYHFARELRRELGVPVGIVQSDWGGTRIEAWMSERALRPFAHVSGEMESIAAMRDPNTRGDAAKSPQDRWWDGLDARDRVDGWTGDAYDASVWKEMELPQTLGADGMGSFDGVVRFRREVELGAAWAGKAAVLELGPIDDRDDAWVNGVHVGSTREDGRWGMARRYDVPAGVLRAGKNVVCVRMLDTAGPGGINGKKEQMRLAPADASVGGAVSLAGEWRYRAGSAMGSLPAIPTGVDVGANTVTALWNAMMAPLTPMRVAGVIWYQGESNRGNWHQYADLFGAMIADWRARFGDDRMVFAFAQIAPFRYIQDRGETAMLREAQSRVGSGVKGVGMATTLDVGNPQDIHPKDKRTVGERLARIALLEKYERRIEDRGPVFAQMEAIDGGRVRVIMSHASGMTTSDGSKDVRGFEVAGKDRRFYPATARVETNDGISGGGSLIVECDAVRSPEAVRYAFSMTPDANLVNGEGLPAEAFRTDDWRFGRWSNDQEAELAAYRSREEGAIELFNGRDLSGWFNMNTAESTWRVKEDETGTPVIVCTGKPVGLLRTEEMYGNYVLELEWRHMVQGGNAGLFVHADPVPARGSPFTRAVEVQVMDGAEGDGYTSDGDVFPIFGTTMTAENGRKGSNRAFPTEKRMNPSPMWNHYRVECVDGVITLSVNGKAVTRGRDTSPCRGYIALESEGTEVQFRNIRLWERPGSDAIPKERTCDVAEGFRPLYNGMDFTGWKFGPEHEGHWQAADNAIVFDGQGADLWTSDSFKDFELIVDWRWTGPASEVARPVILRDGTVKKNADGSDATELVQEAGDSGVYLRGSSKSQVNMWCWGIGSGEVYGYRTDLEMPADVRAGVTPRKKADAPLGQWNRFRIRMVGDRLTVDLNGERVIEEARLPGVAAEGPIALQMHGNPVQFANVLIREIGSE
ncbi:MAG: DUF1080 domain-containing protein [Phycisphaerales bacterium]|jgi:sialate O-acetylesterase|nr:DUF1080 domain-containing protein [Phycisphaerales bacterium]